MQSGARLQSQSLPFSRQHPIGDTTKFHEEFLGEAEKFVGSLLLELRPGVQLAIHCYEYDVDRGVRIWMGLIPSAAKGSMAFSLLSFRGKWRLSSSASSHVGVLIECA